MCDAPSALITFVEAERQWLSADLGLELAERLSGLSFCGYAILAGDVIVVADAR